MPSFGFSPSNFVHNRTMHRTPREMENGPIGQMDAVNHCSFVVAVVDPTVHVYDTIRLQQRADYFRRRMQFIRKTKATKRAKKFLSREVKRPKDVLTNEYLRIFSKPSLQLLELPSAVRAKQPRLPVRVISDQGVYVLLIIDHPN